MKNVVMYFIVLIFLFSLLNPVTMGDCNHYTTYIGWVPCYTACGMDWIPIEGCEVTVNNTHCVSEGGPIQEMCGMWNQPYDCWETEYYWQTNTEPCD